MDVPLYNKDTCCNLFSQVLAFAQGLVEDMAQESPDSEYSIVTFATTGTILSNLTDLDGAIGVLGDVTYSGGFTNHQDAINQCQATFAGTSDPNRKNGEKQQCYDVVRNA